MKASVKRAFDVTISGIAIVLLLPLLLIVAAVIKLDSSGPVFFRQKRLGKEARVFEIVKFRTMTFDPNRNGPSITARKDPRLTRVGRILRRFDLDELPTLFNVIKGEMSIVGPRPEVPKFLPYYSNDERLVFGVKPGLTDFGTLAFRNEGVLLTDGDLELAYVREILPRKLALSLQYLRQQSFLCDLHIITKTLTMILSHPKD